MIPKKYLDRTLEEIVKEIGVWHTVLLFIVSALSIPLVVFSKAMSFAYSPAFEFWAEIFADSARRNAERKKENDK